MLVSLLVTRLLPILFSSKGHRWKHIYLARGSSEYFFYCIAHVRVYDIYVWMQAPHSECLKGNFWELVVSFRLSGNSTNQSQVINRDSITTTFTHWDIPCSLLKWLLVFWDRISLCSPWIHSADRGGLEINCISNHKSKFLCTIYTWRLCK